MNRPDRAEQGDTVVIAYIGTLDNGRIFASSDEDGPLRFTLGKGEVFSPLEEALLGMRCGEAKNVEIPAAQAYGPRLDENLLKVERSLFPADRTLKVGEKVSLSFADETGRVMRVREATETFVILDGNHPLAGADLTIAFRLDEILPRHVE